MPRRLRVARCGHCCKPFHPWRADSNYCSKRCSNRANAKRRVQQCDTCQLPKTGEHFSRSTKADRSRWNTTCRGCAKLKAEQRKLALPWWHKKVAMIICNCRTRAERDGIKFSLTREDIHIPDKCPVFGTPFAPKERTDKRYFGQSYAPSIDRIDNSKGYVPGNIIVVSCRANSIKGDATLEELQAVAKFYRRFTLPKNQERGKNRQTKSTQESVSCPPPSNANRRPRR